MSRATRTTDLTFVIRVWTEPGDAHVRGRLVEVDGVEAPFRGVAQLVGMLEARLGELETSVD